MFLAHDPAKQNALGVRRGSLQPMRPSDAWSPPEKTIDAQMFFPDKRHYMETDACQSAHPPRNRPRKLPVNASNSILLSPADNVAVANGRIEIGTALPGGAVATALIEPGHKV